MNTQKLVEKFSERGFDLYIDHDHQSCIAIAVNRNTQYIIGEGRKEVVKEKCKNFLRKLH